MQYCAGCGSVMQDAQDALGSHRHCSVCGGRTLTFTDACAQPGGMLTAVVWGSARQQAASGPPCPQCIERMDEVPLPGEDGGGKVGVCRTCELLWLDAHAVRILLDE